MSVAEEKAAIVDGINGLYEVISQAFDYILSRPFFLYLFVGSLLYIAFDVIRKAKRASTGGD